MNIHKMSCFQYSKEPEDLDQQFYAKLNTKKKKAFAVVKIQNGMNIKWLKVNIF